MSNSVVMVPREWTHPSIEGVDFGGRCWVLVRSPDDVLLWIYAHSSSVNGHYLYGAPGAYLLPGRKRGRTGSNLRYKRLTEGSRLGRLTLADVVAPLVSAQFPQVTPAQFADIFTHKQTILIEGGGPQLRPDWTRKDSLYERWKLLPDAERGFWNTA